MSKKFVVLALALALTAGVAAAQNSLMGTNGDKSPVPHRPEATEQLFRGDLTPEIGLGCSNGTGNSGGPNDVAVQVTASLAPPFGVISTTYNVFTQNGFVTTHSFVAWGGGATPGAEIGRQPTPATLGANTAAISPAIPVSAASFHFGFNQPETAAGMRWGLDTSGGGTGDSFIRAPSCGATNWAAVTALGFPSNWVMAAVIDDAVPVELMTFDVD